MIRCPIQQVRPVSSACEPLERRALLSVITINGTNGPDEFTIDLDATGTMLLVWQGPTTGDPDFSFPVSEVDGLAVYSGGDDDAVDLREIAVEVPTTLNGGSGHDAFTVGGHAYGAFVRAPVTVSGGEGADALHFLDDATDPSSSDTYRFARSTFNKGLRPTATTFDGVEEVTLDADPEHNYINIDSVAPGVTVRAFGHDGTDIFYVGPENGTTQDIEGRVFVHGDDDPEVPDGDRLYLYDTQTDANTTFGICTHAIDLPYNAASVEYANMYELRLYAGPGDNVFNVTGSRFDNNLGVFGGDGDDTFNLGDPAAGIGLITAGAYVGEAGHDVLNLNDHSTTVARNYSFINGTVRWSPPFVEIFPAVDAVVINGSNAANALSVRYTAAAPALTLNGHGGADNLNVLETTPGTTVTVDGGAGLDRVFVNSDSAGTADATIDRAQDLSELHLFVGGTARVRAGVAALLRTQQLLVDPGAGGFDLADNAAVIDYTGESPIATIQSYLTSGYAQGAWNGPGIYSSVAATSGNTAIGFGEATDLFTSFPGNFLGHSVDDTSILLKHTLYGDANLNGAVNLQDFNRLAGNFGQSPRRWAHGDFNFDGTVNLTDFNKLAADFGASSLALPGGRSGRATGEGKRLPSIEDLLTRPRETE